jgi:hypothetical protein
MIISAPCHHWIRPKFTCFISKPSMRRHERPVNAACGATIPRGGSIRCGRRSTRRFR